MKYGADIMQRICAELEMGVNRMDACEMVGIPFETFNEWMKGNIPAKAMKGLRSEKTRAEAKSAFSEAVRKAELTCKNRNVKVIQKAAVLGSAHAAGWWLERKHPGEFAAQGKLEVTGAGGVPLVNPYKDLTDAELNERIRKALKRLKDHEEGK